MKKDVRAFWKWVDKRAAEVQIESFRKLEGRSGYAPGAIGKRKNASKFPTVEMAEGMCRVLRVSWIELWTQAGFIQSINMDVFSLREHMGHESLETTRQYLTALDDEDVERQARRTSPSDNWRL
jgi:integrase